jgi:hypothetical protein
MRRGFVWAFVIALLGGPCFGIDLEVPSSLLPAGCGKVTVSFQWERHERTAPLSHATNLSGGSSPRIH